MSLDLRKRQILAIVVDEYIKTGEPVGSKTVQSKLGVCVSSATIRNDMAVLERQGYLEQPYTSSGRIPSYVGYRFYIEQLMQPQYISQTEKQMIDRVLHDNSVTADMLLDNAVTVLSDLTQLAVVNTSTLPNISVITRVEVIPTGRRVYALLLITSMGTMKNKICRLEFDLSDQQLLFFKDFINEHIRGLNLEDVTEQVMEKLAVSLGAYMMTLSPLLRAIYELTEDLSSQYVRLIGEQRLFSNTDFKTEQALQLLTQKNKLISFMSSAVDGVSVIFGQEHPDQADFVITNSSMIVSGYQMRHTRAGAFGVIGPLRLDYAKIIPYIAYMSDSVTKLLSEVSDREDWEEEKDDESTQEKR